jgi:hypothetical protein
MHEGLTVDPKTGWDEGPRLGRWIPSLRVLSATLAILWISTAFRPLRDVPWLTPMGVSLLVGAITLVLGLEARALARCPGADTRASRQLRWERAIMYAIVGLLFGVLGCVTLMFVSLTQVPPSLVLRVSLGVVAAAGLGSIVAGLWLAWRHRPDSAGPAEHPGGPERR